MGLPDATRWALLSPLLDELLDLEPGGQASRLEELRRFDPPLARELRDLLDAGRRVAASGMLEGAAEAAPADALAAGTMIGAYRLEAILGEGGSGTVWRARRADGRFEGVVAIKLLHLSRTDRASLARFRREGGILARLTHPNIAKLFDAGVAPGGQPYLVLELVEGEPIDAYADARALTVRQRVELFRQVTLAVAHAHSHLTVHRDIKPSNILVDRHGTVKLLDFGIAKLLDADAGFASDSEATMHGGRFLTPAYAAPEQLSGGELTTATDVYALGIVLHKLLAGGHPTMAERSSVAQAIRATIDADPVALHAATTAGEARTSELARARGTSPQRLVHQLRGDLSNIVAHCLRKGAAERYATAAELGEDLRRHLENEPVRAAPDSLAYRTAKFVRKHRVAVIASVLTTAILVVATIVSTWQLMEARRQHAEAVAAASKAQSWSRFLGLMVQEIGAEDGPKSPTQIIDQGLYLLDQQHRETRPMVDQLEQMSGYYARLNETDKELAVLVRAEALSRKIGYREGLARVLCGSVDAELASNQHDRAQAGLDEARRIIASLSRPDALLAASCESSAAAIDDAAGRSQDAIGHAERALALLSAADQRDDPLYAGIATHLSKYHDDLGHAREAHRYTEIAVEAYDRAGASGTIDRLITLNNEAADFVNFGQLRDALDVSDKVMQRVEARGVGPGTGVGFSANRAAILSSLGRHDEALAVLDRTIAEAAASRNVFWQQRAQFFMARALMRAGRHDEARKALDEIEAIYRRDEAANRGYLESATLTRAELLFRTGDVDGAQAMITGLLKALGYPGDTSSWVLRGALPVAANIALARHDATAAQANAQVAVDLARASALDPARSADLGRALVLLGRAQRPPAGETLALETLRLAVPSLEGGLGADHAEVRDAQRLLTETPVRIARR